MIIRIMHGTVEGLLLIIKLLFQPIFMSAYKELDIRMSAGDTVANKIGSVPALLVVTV